MLTQEQLTEALHEGLKAADPPCGKFCTTGAVIDDGRYHIWHNGTGNRHSDEQKVYSTPVLDKTVEQLGKRLAAWFGDLHRGERSDLNAAWSLIFDEPSGLWKRTTAGPAMLGWPWTRQNVGINPHSTTTLSPNVMTTWRWTDGTAP